MSNRSLLTYTASKRGLSKTLSLETKFFITLMKLRLGLLQQNLGFRLSISLASPPWIGKTQPIQPFWSDTYKSIHCCVMLVRCHFYIPPKNLVIQ